MIGFKVIHRRFQHGNVVVVVRGERNQLQLLCVLWKGNDGNVETSMLSHERRAKNGLTTGYESSEVSSFLLNAIE